MPEISRFLGIVIRMYFNDHSPQHFHVEYNEFEASVVIETLGIMEGRLPAKVLSLAVEWASLHQTELMQNWESIRTTGVFSAHRAASVAKDKSCFTYPMPHTSANTA